MPDEHRILLVEDRKADVLLIQRAFRVVGVTAQVEVVEDGDVAVAYLAGTGPYADRARYPLPSLTLLDLKLPRRSGFEVLEWLRQQPGLRRLVVVMLTSSNALMDVRRAYDLGVNSYLVKPVSPEAMQELVNTLRLYWLTLNEQPDAQTT